MVSEATKVVSQEPRENGPIRATMNRLREIVEMSSELLALQAQLARQDASTAGSKLKPALVSIFLALGLLLSGFPLLAFGLASGVSQWGQIPVWLSQVLIALGCLVLSAILLGYAWKSLSKATMAFEASRLEATENLKWFRRTIDETLR